MYNLRTTYPWRITHFETLVSRDTNCTFLRKFCILLHKVKNYAEKIDGFSCFSQESITLLKI